MLVSIRRCETLIEKLQKVKCDLEFLRCCLIYSRMPTFVNIRLWKSGLKKTEQHRALQRNCLLCEFEFKQEQARQLEKQVTFILTDLEKHLSSIDYINIKKLCHNSVSRIHKHVICTHQNKLEKLNHELIGQNYEEMNMKTKLLHNVLSYVLSASQERLLCRG